MLTNTAVKAARPRAAAYKLFDQGGPGWPGTAMARASGADEARRGEEA
jgi:hypothetical protein